MSNANWLVVDEKQREKIAEINSRSQIFQCEPMPVEMDGETVWVVNADLLDDLSWVAWHGVLREAAKNNLVTIANNRTSVEDNTVRVSWFIVKQ